MKTVEFAINVCDTQLFLYNKKQDEIIGKEFKSLKEDQIIDTHLFIDEFNNLLKKNHIHIPLFGWNACFIKNQNQNPIMTEKYIEIFSDYFRKLDVKNIEDILNFEKDTGFLNITDNYIDYYFMKKNKVKVLRVNPEIFNDNYSKVISYLLTSIYKPEKMTVFGTMLDISKFAENINKNYGISVTFPEKHAEFLLEEYKNR